MLNALLMTVIHPSEGGVPYLPKRSDAAIRAELRNIVESQIFAQSNRLARFLRFVVEHYLSGEAERLKETVIGIDVYDRPPDYDPKIDSIVRTEAHRLRKKLQEYYQTNGRHSRVIITIPLGGYVPQIEFLPQPLPTLVVTEPVQQAKPAKPPLLRSRRSWIVAALIVTGLISGLVLWTIMRQSYRSTIQSVAGLPFKSTSTGAADDLIGWGIADSITMRLGRTRKIVVSPTEAVRRYLELGKEPLAIGRFLHVDAVLTGSVQHHENRFRVTVELLRSRNGRSIWTDEFEANTDDIFSVQDSVSQRLVGSLMLNLSDEESKALAESYTSNMEAYHSYLQGRFYWTKRTPDFVHKAITCFDKALHLDPKYALAYAGLADAYAVTASGLPASERFAKAKIAAERALTLQESLAEAHTSLAFVLYKFERNWLEAENHFRRALQLNPSYALSHHWFGEFLVLIGRSDEGLARLKQAESLDPLSLPIKNDLARAFYRTRHYDEAIAKAQSALELDPNFRNAYATLAYAYEQKRDYPRAVQADLQILRLSKIPADKIVALETAFAKSGWKGYWQSELELLQGGATTGPDPAYVLAEVYLRLGNRDAALRALEKSFEDRGDAPLLIGVEPLFDPLRSNAEFADLLRQAGLPETHAN